MSFSEPYRSAVSHSSSFESYWALVSPLGLISQLLNHRNSSEEKHPKCSLGLTRVQRAVQDSPEITTDLFLSFIKSWLASGMELVRTLVFLRWSSCMESTHGFLWYETLKELLQAWNVLSSRFHKFFPVPFQSTFRSFPFHSQFLVNVKGMNWEEICGKIWEWNLMELKWNWDELVEAIVDRTERNLEVNKKWLGREL